ncbi:interleukin-17 receptor C isoform X2 [Rhinatrema bivittatum]|uniref:interleukin-17 receptor C isoform X2 n=1 Tax=Rhinatrema bivittatum TaxID=194408 RepID=UPI001126B2F2|nr:interleukin-17 receptor C isoform X2 [Rhinatrema bivittatum]
MRTSGILGLLLTVVLSGELCTLEKTGYEVSCSPGLLCKLDETAVLCMPDSTSPIQGPVLVPTAMRTKTMLHCPEGGNCSPCVQLELDISALGIVEEPDNEDVHREDVEEEDAEDEDRLVEDSSLEGSSYASHSGNGSFVRTLVIFSQTFPSQTCIAAEVCAPLSFLQQNLNKENVGTVVFDCFDTVPSAEVHLQSYTNPRYRKELDCQHYIPDCRQLMQMGDVKNCQTPHLQVSIQKDVVVGVMNGSRNGGNNFSISHWDVVPCLCVEAWWKDIQDAPRQSTCPFWNYTEYQENTWKKSKLTLNVHDKKLAWLFQAPCSVSGEIVLCWHSSPDSQCHEIPSSRQKIPVHVMQEFKTMILHPALCVQVWGEGKIWHKQCPHEDFKDGWERNEVLVMVTQSSVANFSICILEGGSCVPLGSSLKTNLRKAEFLERQLLQDSLSDECKMVWRPHGNISGAVLVCSLDKYMRRRLTLAWPICILIGICAFLLLMLQNKRLKEWLKFLKEDYNSPGFVSGRRVLILYSPDHTGFERLVGIFASALQDLHLKVTVDLWYRSRISAVGSMGWFHKQRLEVLEQKGIIVLLFSKGALDKCTEWLLLRKGTQPVMAEEPPSVFDASLNCVLPTFLEKVASDHYIIACFEDLFCQKDIPPIFQSVPVFPLPSQLTKFLVALAGGSKMVRSKGLLKKHSKRIGHKLRDTITKCAESHPSESQLDKQLSESFLLGKE